MVLAIIIRIHVLVIGGLHSLLIDRDEREAVQLSACFAVQVGVDADAGIAHHGLIAGATVRLF